MKALLSNTFRVRLCLCRKIYTTKALLKLHLKAAQHHSYDVGKDESETENVDVMEDDPVSLNRQCLIPFMKVFLINTFETTYKWKDLLQNHFLCCYTILNRSYVVDEYLYLFKHSNPY